MPKRITIDYYKKLEKDLNIKYLCSLDESLPKNTAERRRIYCLKCKYGIKEIWAPLYCNLKNKHGCPKCTKKLKRTIEDYEALGKKKNIRFIDLYNNFPKNVNTPTKAECLKCNYGKIESWTPTFDNLNTKSGCPNCVNRKIKTIKDYNELAEINNIELDIKTAPKNTYSIIKAKCKICNNIWDTKFAYLITNDGGCPKCREKGSLSEKIVFEYLNELYPNKFKRNIKLDILNYKKNNNKSYNLELDLFCEEKSLAIEVQGRQHYKYPNFFHKTKAEFEKQQTLDKIKKQLCEENNISLIEIKALDFHKKEKMLLELKTKLKELYP